MKDRSVTQATVARMAGNIAAGLIPNVSLDAAAIARLAVQIARAIVRELDTEDGLDGDVAS